MIVPCKPQTCSRRSCCTTVPCMVGALPPRSEGGGPHLLHSDIPCFTYDYDRCFGDFPLRPSRLHTSKVAPQSEERRAPGIPSAPAICDMRTILVSAVLCGVASAYECSRFASCRPAVGRTAVSFGPARAGPVDMAEVRRTHSSAAPSACCLHVRRLACPTRR